MCEFTSIKTRFLKRPKRSHERLDSMKIIFSCNRYKYICRWISEIIPQIFPIPMNILLNLYSVAAMFLIPLYNEHLLSKVLIQTDIYFDNFPEVSSTLVTRGSTQRVKCNKRA